MCTNREDWISFVTDYEKYFFTEKNKQKLTFSTFMTVFCVGMANESDHYCKMKVQVADDARLNVRGKSCNK